MGQREDAVRQRLWALKQDEQSLLSDMLNKAIDEPTALGDVQKNIKLRTIRRKLEKLNMVPYTPKPGGRKERDRK